MGRGTHVVLLVLWVTASGLAEDVTCTYEDQASGLKKATCSFPTCAGAEDCKPPEIDKSSAKIEFKAPWTRLRKPCNASVEGDDPTKLPSSCREIRGACWEIKKKYTFTLSAQDASPIESIGPGLALDIGPDKRIFVQPMVAPKKLGSLYRMEDEIHACIPLAGKLDITVQKLCARDSQFNEGCTLPKFVATEENL